MAQSVSGAAIRAIIEATELQQKEINQLDIIKATFEKQRGTFDKGGLGKRYTEAKNFTNTYCVDTPYVAVVEEYCCGSTVTVLKNKNTREVIC
jgi:hypothetical protein